MSYILVNVVKIINTFTFVVIDSVKTNDPDTREVSNAKRRTYIKKEDVKIYESLIYCNKEYHIKIIATGKIRLVVVVKAHRKPDLWDLYGGNRLSDNTAHLTVDFAMTRQSLMDHDSTSSGLEYVVEDANSSTVSLFGTVHCSEETTTTYVGIMPTVYDTELCKRCEDNSNGPCGFCSGKDVAEDDIYKDVNVSVVRYVADCVFWDKEKDDWKNDGCQVSVVYSYPCVSLWLHTYAFVNNTHIHIHPRIYIYIYIHMCVCVY